MDPLAAINPLQRFNPFAPQSPLAASVIAQWETEFQTPGFLDTSNGRWHTRQGRDELVYRLIFICDYRFARYEADLVAGKATRDTFVDVAVLGLTSAAALTTPGQATQILAAISGGLIGSRAAVERNFYQNMAQPVLLRKMQVLRAQKLFAISHRLRKYNVDVYPTERALIDVLDYYNRGTMLAALQEISNDTAAQEIQLGRGQVTVPPIEGTSPPPDLNLDIGNGSHNRTSPEISPTPKSTPSPTPKSTPSPTPKSTPSPTPKSTPSPTPKNSPEPTPEELHSLQKELIKRLRNISDQQATEVLGQFAPAGFPISPQPKTRLQVLISRTLDFPTLTKMSERIPLPSAELTTRDVHGLQKMLIKGLRNVTDQEATDILDEFAPPTFSKAGIPKIRLQVLISNTSDFVTLSNMGGKIPH